MNNEKADLYECLAILVGIAFIIISMVLGIWLSR